MSTTVGDPFLLASYSIPHTFKSHAIDAPKRNLYTSHQHGQGAEGRVIAAAQGDGLHIVDLSTLHPVVSHTLGPTSVFSCPAVSRAIQDENGSTCTTYAVLESVQGISPDERGRSVRKWTDRLAPDGTFDAEGQQTKNGVVSHRVSRILVLDDLPQAVLFVGEKGELTVTDVDLKTMHAHAHKDDALLIRVFAFGRRSCSFVPSRSSFKQGAVVVMLLQTGEGIVLSVLGASQDGISLIGECLVPVENTDVTEVSFSDSGFLSILFRSGEWHSLQTDTPDHTNITLVQLPSALCLKGLTFVSNAGVVSPLEEVSIMSLGSSHVLLAGVTTGGSSELAMLLWDLQYGVLLASRTIPVPSSMQRNKKQGIDMHLSIASAQQALLVLSPKTTPGSVNGASVVRDERSTVDASQRSSILVLPYTVPSASTVANALGRASAGEKWLAPPSSRTASSKTPVPSLNEEQGKCLRIMRTAMDQKRVEAADEAFFAWATQIESRNANAPAKGTANKLSYGYEFVKQVLEIVLRAPKGSSADIPYSPKIVRHLLDKRCISSNMVPGGLLPALILRKDWQSVLIGLKAVIDVSEDDLVSFLGVVSGSPRQREKQRMSETSAMDVDSTASDSSILSLASVLPLCITYPTSAGALRVAFRRHLSDAEALTSVLAVLARWLRTHSEEDEQLLPEGTKIDAHGALLPAQEAKKKRRHMLPPVDKILAFVQTILDASFLALLAYPPAHPVLRDIGAVVQPELEFTDEVEQLRGPLEPFVRAHDRMVREAANGEEKPDPTVDWRKRRREAHDQAAIAVGVYRVEELTI